MQKESTIIYHIIAFVTVAIWGSTFISTKLLIHAGLAPDQIFVFRFLIAYVLMLGISFFGKKKDEWRRWWSHSWKDEAIMLLLGITGGSAYFLTENEALRYSTATNVSLIVCSCPLFTMILLRLLFRETRLNSKQVLGTVLSFVGMTVVVLNGKFVLQLSPLGDMLAFSACLAWAFYTLFMKMVADKYSSFYITRKVFFYGLITMLPYYLIKPGFPLSSQLLTPMVIGNFIFLGVLASLICFLTWTWCVYHLGAMKATNYIYVNPITTIFFAGVILKETITPYFIIGTICILIGLFLSSKSKMS